MIVLKNPEVNITNLCPELFSKLPIIGVIYAIHNQNLVITSGNDGKHMKNSLHYKDRAVDLRIWYLTKEQINTIVEMVQKQLGDDFDVVLEPNHIHVEYDPN